MNNCIGQKNYNEFFKLLLAVSSFGILFVFFALYVYEELPLGLQIWLLVNFILVMSLFFANFNLMIFHFWLRIRRLTTYEYILHQRKQKIQPEIDPGTKW